METKWIIKPKIDKKLCDNFPEYSPLMIQLLFNRGLVTAQAIDEFFNADYVDHIYDPFLLRGMEEAVKRIYQAIKNQEKILVYGDYDADGVTSTTIMVKALKFLGADNVAVYIPDRAKEGYGLKEAAILKFKKNKINLIITVDCGVASRKEIDLANELKIDVIVTDHHWVPDELPKALAIINPKQNNDPYPFKKLAGVGVAFKLIQGLLNRQDSEENLSPGKKVSNKNEVLSKNQEKLAFEKWLLDLVALGTIADSVPLTGENRTLAMFGLIVMGKTKNNGLRALIGQIRERKSQKDNGTKKYSKPEEKIASDFISFQIAPRINAAGRLDHANTSFALLNADSKKEAEGLAKSLELLNSKRQTLTESIMKEVRKRLEGKPLGKIIFEGSADWPAGLLGLIAGKITDEFSRPTFIFNQDKNLSGGSCRSIPSFNIIEALSQNKELLEEFGGHKAAAGFKVKNKNLEKLKDALEKIAKRQIKNDDLAPAVKIDAEINASDAELNFFREVEKMAPFGEGNPEPVFLLHNMEIIEMRTVGNGEKHLKFSLREKSKEKNKTNKIYKAIGFNFGEWINKTKLNDLIDVVFTFSVNEWNGYSNLEFKIIDIKAAK